MSRTNFKKIKQLQKKMEQASREGVTQEVVEKAVYEIANKTLAQTKRRTAPSDTGHLRRNWNLTSINKEEDHTFVEIYNNVEYASFVENGHRGVAVMIEKDGEKIGYRVMHVDDHWTEGRFMLRNSIEAVSGQVETITQKHVRNYLKELMK